MSTSPALAEATAAAEAVSVFVAVVSVPGATVEVAASGVAAATLEIVDDEASTVSAGDVALLEAAVSAMTAVAADATIVAEPVSVGLAPTGVDSVTSTGDAVVLAVEEDVVVDEDVVVEPDADDASVLAASPLAPPPPQAASERVSRIVGSAAACGARVEAGVRKDMEPRGIRGGNSPGGPPRLVGKCECAGLLRARLALMKRRGLPRHRRIEMFV